MQFDEVELYHGINFKKTLKAPSQFCFSLRVSQPLAEERGALCVCGSLCGNRKVYVVSCVCACVCNVLLL